MTGTAAARFVLTCSLVDRPWETRIVREWNRAKAAGMIAGRSAACRADASTHDDRISMGLRYAEDRKTLMYALVLMPGARVIQIFFPVLIGWALPVALYLGFCAGVLSHNQNHCPIFRSRGKNLIYAAWLSALWGHPI